MPNLFVAERREENVRRPESSRHLEIGRMLGGPCLGFEKTRESIVKRTKETAAGQTNEPEVPMLFMVQRMRCAA